MKRAIGSILAPLLLISGPYAALANEYQIAFLTVEVNGTQSPAIFTALRDDNKVMLPPMAFSSLGIRMPQVAQVPYKGHEFYDLGAVEGLSYAVDEQRQAVLITCTPACFHASRVSATADRTFERARADTGAFLNYDINLEHNDGRNDVSGLIDAGLFGDFGHVTASMLARELADNGEFLRLETAWEHDDPTHARRWRVGDSITTAGQWGIPSRFAGIQLATDFALQPGFVHFPTPLVQGATALPSTVDVYVNDIRRFTRDIPPGPFTIDDLPVLTGGGEIRTVVTDLLGRERVISGRYYASPQLLRPGLSDYAVEGGILRRAFGLESNDYATPFASATYRRGLHDSLTVEARAEASSQGATAGGGVAFILPFGGTVNANAAVSHHGGLAVVGYDLDMVDFGFGINSRFASRHFDQIGLAEGAQPERQVTSARVGFPVGKDGSLSASYVFSDRRDSIDSETVNANYSVRIGDIGSLNVNGLHSFDNGGATIVSVNLTIPLGPRMNGSVGSRTGHGKPSHTVRAHRSAPSDGGLDVHVSATRGTPDILRLDTAYEGNHGIAALNLSKVDNHDAARLGLRGGLATLGSSIFASRPIDQSFAVVEVGDYSGVSVLRDNRPIAVTGSDGRTLVTGLRAFEDNRIAIDPLDLPIDAELSTTEQIVVPTRRSGVRVAFSVGGTGGGIVTLVRPDGMPVPAGARVTLKARDESYPVGRNGRTYIPELPGHVQGVARWDQVTCRFEGDTAGSNRPIPRFGPWVCKETTP